MISTAIKNILETSTVTLEGVSSATGEDTSYPLYRLYDRDIGLVFKPDTVETIDIYIDQGADNIYAVDRLIIPSGHNLDGLALDIFYSDDDITYTEATTQWTQDGNGAIIKSWTSRTHRYWMFRVTDPSSIPQIPELFLTQTYVWEADALIPYGPYEKEFNVENILTSSGKDRFIEYGNAKRQRPYKVRGGSAQEDNIVSFYNMWGGKLPFWLYDDEGTWIYGKLRNPLDLKKIGPDAYEFMVDFLEVLA